MSTTTIRVDTDTHARLAEISQEAGTTLGDTVRDAVEALWRQRFANEVMRQLDELRQDSAAWKEYLGEAEETHIADGIG